MGTLTFTSGGGNTLRHLVETNSTQSNASGVAPTNLMVSGRVKSFEGVVPPGLGSLTWDSPSRVVLTAPPGPFATETNTFEAQFDVARVSTTVPQGRTYVATAYQELPPTILWMWFGYLEGLQRDTTLENGTLQAVGDVTLFLEGATATFADGSSFSVPERYENVTRAGVPGVGDVRVMRIHYGFLTLHDARIEVPVEGTHVLCRDLQAEVDGAIRLSLAEGVLEQPGSNVSFVEQELGLWGRLTWTEEIQGTSVEASGVGIVQSATIDFAPAGRPNSGPSLAEVGLWATILAAIGAAAYFAAKGIFGFFSRLTEHRLVQHPGRALVLETVRTNPNVTLHSLATSTGLHKSVVRYHARVLEARGLLRSHRVLQDRCFVARDTIKAEGRGLLQPSMDLVLRNDAAVAEVARSVPAEGIRLYRLIESVASSLGISKPGAWKAVQRAQDRGLVQRFQVGREVWVRNTN